LCEKGRARENIVGLTFSEAALPSVVDGLVCVCVCVLETEGLIDSERGRNI